MREYFDPRAVLVTTSAISIGLVLIFLGLVATLQPEQWSRIVSIPNPINIIGNRPTVNGLSVVAFKSAQEYKTYLTEAADNYGSGYFGGFMGAARMPMAMEDLSLDTATNSLKEQEIGGMGSSQAPEDVSQTNVQVAGIDEPDIVKTDGKQIYVSQPQYYYPWMGVRAPGMMEERIMVPPERKGGVKTIEAFPPANLKILGSIEESGDLLLVDKMLVVFAQEKLVGYDVANPASPEKKWELKYEDNHRLIAARLAGKKIYLITQAYASPDSPCPIRPLSSVQGDIIVPCTSIYHPVDNIPVDASFSVLTLNPILGEVGNKVSFLGSSSQSQVAMFADNIYVTYSYPGDVIGYLAGMFSANQDLFPSWVIEKINKLKTYDISLQAKMSEFEQVMETFQRGLSNDERLRVENEMQNRLTKYATEHLRELQRTSIVKVAVTDLSVKATRDVPGQLLNQFALDEYQSHLRVATTFGSSWFSFGSSETASDVYVFDSAMREVGSVKDLGKTERIYSVRFVGDRGYVVTFRQTDPFYILDLSKPDSPKLTGELKIPGFSSYLHPLAPGRVLGVGQENGQVKLSLFDVSNAANPVEKAKYNLDDYWSEVAQTHHAFLQDARHSIVFLPGGKGGYIFSYKNDDLKLVSAVSELRARRALYLDDYLYIVGDEKIKVLNEIDWTVVKELDLIQ